MVIALLPGMWRVVLGLGALLVTITGCGGRMEKGSRETDGTDDAPQSSGGSSSKPSTTPDLPADTDLGDCVRGPAETYGIPCPWVADARCYEARDMACNCACPRNRNSQCLSGFEAGPDGHVEVVCQ